MPLVEIPFDRGTRDHLPPVCVVTGGEQDLVWFRLVLPRGAAGPAVIELPLTQDAQQRWLRLMRTAPLALTACFAPLLVTLAVALPPLSGPWTMALVAALVVPAMTVLVLLGRRVGPRVARIGPTSAVIRIPSPRAADAIRERLASATLADRPPDGARCAAHAIPATGLCARCGAFTCPTCGAAPFCGDCADRHRELDEGLLARAESRGRRMLIFTNLVGLLPGNVPLKLAGLILARSLLRTAHEPRTRRLCRIFTITSGLGLAVDVLFLVVLFA